MDKYGLIKSLVCCRNKNNVKNAIFEIHQGQSLHNLLYAYSVIVEFSIKPYIDFLTLLRVSVFVYVYLEQVKPSLSRSRFIRITPAYM